ncbi:hypothetical protein BofuT4_P107350.1 [Botrytis cinerea T4]|uniref:Uncharacterized protein n=1 Tax=Botryotinia fuckeliana (strain T4) TaxID=999810 RepID=G2Y6U9_BOTF4|nr:hypothetical protein BofuT4_P107350.1 [Botrytis cinerea T4]
MIRYIKAGQHIMLIIFPASIVYNRPTPTSITLPRSIYNLLLQLQVKFEFPQKEQEMYLPGQNSAAFSNQNFLPEATKNLTYGDILTLVFGVIGIAMAATTVWQNQRTYRNSVLNTMQDEFEAVIKTNHQIGV